MLLEFATKNYKSFLEEMVFSMVPAPKQRELDYSIIKEKIGRNVYKSLCTSVIYGPNASGKTNIIGAMDDFKAIVLKGNIKNSSDERKINASNGQLELIPNNTLAVPEPTIFKIKYIDQGVLFEYELSVDLGLFLQSGYPRKILTERLSFNNKVVFIRDDNGLTFKDLNIVSEYLVKGLEENLSGIITLASNNLDPQELFLINGFKAMFSSKLVAMISTWFEYKFTVIYRADAIEITKKVKESAEGTVYIEKTISEAAKIFGISSNDLGYVTSKDGDAKLCSVFSDLKTAVPIEMFESYGTVRFINIFPLIIKSLYEGATLVLDEFDAHIHPIALMNIINLFHDDQININKAQLIFNTHNPIFLNSNLFRRDEIKFVERDDNTHLSFNYSLADFKTSGKDGVRKGEDYLNKYFIGRYGAIKDVDFYDLVQELMSKPQVKGTANEN